MKARPAFIVITAAFIAWLLVAVRTGAGDPPPTTTSAPDPAPPPAPPPKPQVVTVERRVQGKNARQWHRVAARYRRTLQATVHADPVGAHWLERSFGCIHSLEGSWRDPNPPYWGGLQMDRAFMRAYMPWAYDYFGTADRWPISVQIAAGIHAVISGRGFQPWPNTARVCGLIR